MFEFLIILVVYIFFVFFMERYLRGVWKGTDNGDVFLLYLGDSAGLLKMNGSYIRQKNEGKDTGKITAMFSPFFRSFTSELGFANVNIFGNSIVFPGGTLTGRMTLVKVPDGS